MIRNAIRRVAVPTLLAAGMVAGLAGTAQAGTGSPVVAKPNAVAGATTQLNPGEQQLYSTWFWGATRLCATNYDGRTGTLTVQSTSPAAGPEYLSVPSGSTACIDRWWWGVPVWAINSGVTDLYVSTS
ncbi:hypothetical protein ACQP2Y_11580 [Actinoplanes sp. CA-051413]|uniref:hypothetical protein n=1 Tax=Actinoplanes sp. CA-051413 TaxID=3239899 RepID=UPI003D9714DF